MKQIQPENKINCMHIWKQDFGMLSAFISHFNSVSLFEVAIRCTVSGADGVVTDELIKKVHDPFC